MTKITDCSVDRISMKVSTKDYTAKSVPEKGDIIVMRVKGSDTMRGELIHYLVIEDRPNSLFTLLNVGNHGRGNLMSTVYSYNLHELVDAITKTISRLEFVEIIPKTEFDSWSTSIVNQQKEGK